MAHIYPSLRERFESEGICPICSIAMAHAPRFTCDNGHLICQRCRPYYYSCPQCLNPLREICPPMSGPPPVQNMHPPHLSHPYPPSAPGMHEFHDQERLQIYWPPQHQPCTEEQDLIRCPYSHLGCTAKLAPILREMHVSRCQYRQHGSSECVQPPYEQSDDNCERIACRYQYQGCNVRAPRWRLDTHENLCIYKNRSNRVESALHHPYPGASCNNYNDGDPSEIVGCRFHSAGCMVRMPRWKRESHEAKCNYGYSSGYAPSYDQYRGGSCNVMQDPEEYADCRWAMYGCKVRPKYAHKYVHEEKCNYRM